MKERIMVSRTFQPRRFEPVRVEIEVVREFVSENDVKATAIDLNQQIKLVVDTIIEDDEKHGRPFRLPEPNREDFNQDRPPKIPRIAEGVKLNWPKEVALPTSYDEKEEKP